MSRSTRNLIVFDHPYTAKACNNEEHFRSFSAALCRSITEKLLTRGEEVDLIDLVADGFDPVVRAEDLTKWRMGEPLNAQIADYQQRMMEADRIIFIFPIWWELMPAPTKGFLDKVYAKNILYTQEEGSFKMKTLLKPGVEVVLVTTMGSPKLLYKVLFSRSVVKALHLGTCLKTGIKHFKWLSYAQVDELSLAKRQALLHDVDI